MNYKDKLKDPRWISRRREILIRDHYECQLCGSKGKEGNELHVHHLQYIVGKEPWDYKNMCLVTLCDRCHNEVHKHNIQLSLRYSSFSGSIICEEPFVWNRVRNYDGVPLLIRQGTVLASDEINKVFVAAGYPYHSFKNHNGGDRLQFTKLPRHTEVEALFTLDKEGGFLSINEYIFPLDGIFGIHPRYATQEEKDMMYKAICEMIGLDKNE